MSIYSIASVFAFMCCCAVGLFVFLKDPRKLLNQSFAIIAFLAGAWTAFPFLISLPEDDAIATVFGRAIYVFASFVPTAFYYFVTVLLNRQHHKAERTVTGVLLFSSLLFAIATFSDRFIEGVSRGQSLFVVNPGPFYIPFVLFFGIGCGLAFFLSFKDYLISYGARRNQLKYVLTSFAFAYSAGLLHFVGAYIKTEPIPHDLLLIAFAALITYAIARHRLMDITVVINKGLAYGLLLAIVFLPIYIGVVVGQRATPYSIPPLLAGTFVFACGLWNLLKDSRDSVNRSIAALCLCVATWLLSSFMAYSANNDNEAVFWGKFAHLGIVYIPLMMHHFTVRFLAVAQGGWSLRIHVLIATLFASLLPSSYLLDGQTSYFWGNYPKAGTLHPLFLAYFGSVCGLLLHRLYIAYKNSKRRSDAQTGRIKYMFWAFLIGFMASLDFVQSYGIEIYPSGYLSAVLWASMVTYHALKKDAPIPALSANLMPYAQISAFTVLFYTITLGLILSFTGSMHYLLAGIIVAISLVFAELLSKSQKQVEKALTKAFFRNRHDAYQTLSEFSKSLVTILDLRSLTEEITATLTAVIRIRKATLYLHEKEKTAYVLSACRGFDMAESQLPQLDADSGLPHFLVCHPSILVREELEASSPTKLSLGVIETLRSLESEVCVPLVNKDRLIGFFNLGTRVDHQMYSEEDLGLLSTLAQNAAIALDNAMLYEDLKRSQILMRRTDRLRSLETIAGGFAHEIRNPLTSIKTFVQLAPDRKDDPEFIGHFSRVVSEDVDRIERLIQEILDYARYMEPKFSEDDLNDVVASCLYFIEVKADSKSVQIEKDMASDLPRMLLDRQQIKQVLLNLFLNAMDAMADTGGRLTVRTHRLIKASGESWVQVEVADTGSGISPADLEHIFDPFYTTKHESGEREGTGLGLTIVHQIVQEHGGYIEVTSHVGTGTTFYVNLPVNPISHHVSREHEEHEKTSSIS